LAAARPLEVRSADDVTVRRGVAEPQGGYGYYKGWSPFFGGRGQHWGAEIARRNAMRARRAESRFAVQLRHIARHVGNIVRGMLGIEPSAAELSEIEAALDAYARLIEPWATATATRMLRDVERRDAAGWHRLGQEIHRALRQEIEAVPISSMLDRLLEKQVGLITSLPREASERVHRLNVEMVHVRALEVVVGGRRWEDIVEDIQATGDVTLSRANTIARTEVARSASEIQATRAMNVGSEGFIWRTAKDRDVRLIHERLEGKYFPWNDPPLLDNGRPGLPGTIYNCRCWAEPVLEGGPVDRPLARSPAYLAALRAAGYTAGTAFE
jgi:SPP1 gp7 family putative phage head morphogenesis protein